MRVAVVSDIHGNLVALDAVIAAAGPIDAYWHLGDVVGYGPDPNGVVRRLREIGAVGVRGNHDAAAAGGSEIEWFNPDARRAMEWTRGQLAPDAVRWLADLPERRTLGEFELVHGSPRQPIWEYVTTTAVAAVNLERLTVPTGLHGHTHVPVAWLDRDGTVELVEPEDGTALELPDAAAGGRGLLNPGSVGQPRDGDRRSSYLVLDTEARRATWHRVEYAVADVQRAMREVGLPAPLVARLAAGL